MKDAPLTFEEIAAFEAIFQGSITVAPEHDTERDAPLPPGVFSVREVRSWLQRARPAPTVIARHRLDVGLRELVGDLVDVYRSDALVHACLYRAASYGQPREEALTATIRAMAQRHSDLMRSIIDDRMNASQPIIPKPDDGTRG